MKSCSGISNAISLEKLCISPFFREVYYRNISIDIISQVVSILSQQHHKSKETCVHMVNKILNFLFGFASFGPN